jgi:hypothetical protein
MLLRITRGPSDAITWTITAILASLTHPLADVFVSGSAAYSPWGVQLFWPLTDRDWSLPRVPWGDVGITLLFAAGAALMVWRPQRIQLLAALTLSAVAFYILAYPWVS